MMARLMAVEALPRGERMARFTTEGVYSACLDPLWLRLAERGTVVGALLEREGECEDEKAAARLWRDYAAPLRKARDERQYAWACADVLRQEVERLRGGRP